MRGGEPLLARYFGADDDRSLLPAGLVARPVTAMAVGLALADRRIASLDAPVATWLPEWDDEPRGRITLRQLLEDTSGLQTGADTHGLLRRSPWDDLAHLPAFATDKGVRMLLGNDFARTALRFELDHEPGGFHNLSPGQYAARGVDPGAGQRPAVRRVRRRARVASGRRRARRAGARSARRHAGRALLLARHGPGRGARAEPAGHRVAFPAAGRCCPRAGYEEMARASRVNAGSGMQLARLSIDELAALGGGDDKGSAFWVIPERQLVIVNIVNQEGASPPELAAALLRALAPALVGDQSANIGSRTRGAGAQNVRMDMNVTSTTDSHTADPADSFVDSRDFARMTRAIEFIEREFERQPRLAEIAQTRRPVGISFQPAVPSLDRPDSQAVPGRGDQPRGRRCACAMNPRSWTRRTL